MPIKVGRIQFENWAHMEELDGPGCAVDALGVRLELCFMKKAIASAARRSPNSPKGGID